MPFWPVPGPKSFLPALTAIDLYSCRHSKAFPLTKMRRRAATLRRIWFPGKSEEYLLVHGGCAGNEFSFTVIAQDRRIVVQSVVPVLGIQNNKVGVLTLCDAVVIPQVEGAGGIGGDEAVGVDDLS